MAAFLPPTANRISNQGSLKSRYDCYLSNHKIHYIASSLHDRDARKDAARRTKGITMSDVVLQKLPGRARGRPFEKGQSGNPAGRRLGSAIRRHSPPQRFSRGESEALTRTAVELALAGDPTAMRLCIERILPPCHERAVKFTSPPIESTDDISAAMQAVTAALAKGDITPGEAATIAGVVETFARAIDTTKRRGVAVDPL
jgi:hypothetical protein